MGTKEQKHDNQNLTATRRDKGRHPELQIAPPQMRWSAKERGAGRCVALAVAQNAIVAAGKLSDPGAKKKTWAVYALAHEDGEIVWQKELPSEPLTGALSIGRDSRIVVGLLDGSVVCFGPE